MIYNLGSINADHFYTLAHLPQPGETLAASELTQGLGGKGANISVAVTKAGGRVRHIGAVGPDGAWTKERLAQAGIDVAHIATVDVPTGHAIINIDPQGENSIVVLAGANRFQSERRIDAALQDANRGDLLMIQNETNGRAYAAARAREKGMRVFYAAAPFDADAVAGLLPLTDILVLNGIEFQQLEQATRCDATGLGVELIVVTRGAEGAELYAQEDGWAPTLIPAPRVDAVDTTGAGDTFAGYLGAGLDADLELKQAAARAVAAAAVKVTRRGTSGAIPSLEEVRAFFG
jgi:ribokinase